MFHVKHGQPFLLRNLSKRKPKAQRELRFHVRACGHRKVSGKFDKFNSEAVRSEKDFVVSLAKYQAKKAPIEDEPVLGLQARLRSGKTTEIHILLPVSEGRRNKDAY